ncbi:hypothetical protein SRB5_59960 [Streptomyces sp. RB5]|uniref:Uncharacterized protein n=1 Tax=Streptomyces smaragdinus TaxID=2585196 RepID=A0A7K0CQP4_9ACTN|nr:Tat pathway signal protein [Streptomyces smaragdinus]MQY15805.1 hypothetical protein [Streptomyces smaragdinus]
MTYRPARSRLTTAVLTAAVAGALAISASPASASTSSGYISGADTYTDDWGDEGNISQSSHASSNATCLWQQILWAEGAVEQDGSKFDKADIDGVFGPNTYRATMNLQDRWPLKSVDGIVGNATWGYAGGRLSFYDYATEYGGGLILTYTGAENYFYLVRAANGRYFFWEGSSTDSGAYKWASYTSRTCG